MPITDGKYVAPTWMNNAAPPISADELQAMSDTIVNNQSGIANTRAQFAQNLGIIAREGSLVVSMRDLEAEFPDNYVALDGRTLTSEGVSVYKGIFPLQEATSGTAVNVFTSTSVDGTRSNVYEYRGVLFFLNTNYGTVAYSFDKGETWLRAESWSRGHNPTFCAPCGDYVVIGEYINSSSSDYSCRFFIFHVPENGTPTYDGVISQSNTYYSLRLAGIFPETGKVLAYSYTGGNPRYFMLIDPSAMSCSYSTYSEYQYYIDHIRYVAGRYAGVKNYNPTGGVYTWYFCYGNTPTSFTNVAAEHEPTIFSVGDDYDGTLSSSVIAGTSDGYIAYSTDYGVTYSYAQIDSDNTSQVCFLDKIGGYWYTFHQTYSGFYRCAPDANGLPTGTWEKVTIDGESEILGTTLSGARAYKRAWQYDDRYIIPVLAPAATFLLTIDTSSTSATLQLMRTALTQSAGGSAALFLPEENQILFVSATAFYALQIDNGSVKTTSVPITFSTYYATLESNFARQFPQRGEAINVPTEANNRIYGRDESIYNAIFINTKNALPTVTVTTEGNVGFGTYFCFDADGGAE